MNEIKDQVSPVKVAATQSNLQSIPAAAIIDSGKNYNRVLQLSEKLHRSLVAEEILQQFFVEVSVVITLDGLRFDNKDELLEVSLGNAQKHSLKYSLTLHGVGLGDLQLTAKRAFTETEINTLEDFITALVYPLNNAFNYARAVRTSFQDALTGAGNRAALERDLDRECSLARRTKMPLSVLMLDLDKFKHVNDNWGHQCGDDVLKSTASTILESTRGSDMIYRYGGEEFLLILACTPSDGARLVAERIRKDIASMTLDIDEGQFSITASLGVSTLNEGDNTNSLIRRADEALYQAKSEGRNQVQLAG